MYSAVTKPVLQLSGLKLSKRSLRVRDHYETQAEDCSHASETFRIC